MAALSWSLYDGSKMSSKKTTPCYPMSYLPIDSLEADDGHSDHGQKNLRD